MAERRPRVLAIASAPAQYQAPLFRRMAGRDDVDLHVAYCTLRGAEAAHDPDFGATVKWDVPLLDGYPWRHVPNKGSGAESFFGLRNPDLWRVIRGGNFDALLCYVSYRRASFWIALLAAKLSGAAFLFGTDTTTLDAIDGRSWKRSVKRALWPMLFRLADQVIVPSSGSLELMRRLGISEERVTLTPYVVDNEWWIAEAGKADREVMRKRWGAGADEAVILFCAKLQPRKRPQDLLAAFERLDPDVLKKSILVFAGEGPLRGQLEGQAASLGDRVRFLGFANQSQLPAIYAAADVMVLPSEFEPFGVVVNEAMLCGCPVICSDRVGAARDLIVDGRTGFMYRCGEIDALRDVLQRALSDRSALAEMSRSARARMQTWSPRENIEATLNAVRRAAGQYRRGAEDHESEDREKEAGRSHGAAATAATLSQKSPE
jgi:glycosyltransferase involved in cell wall biosynthesis